MKLAIFIGIVFLPALQAEQVSPASFDLVSPWEGLYPAKQLQIVLPSDVQDIPMPSLPPMQQKILLPSHSSYIPAYDRGKGIGNILYNPHYELKLK